MQTSTTAGMQTVIYPVRDLDSARGVYTALLGVEPYIDQPYYVGFRVAGQELGLDPHGHGKGMTGPVGYWQVEDVRASVERLVEAGARIASDVTDVGGGKLIATLTDADGNPIGLTQDPR